MAVVSMPSPQACDLYVAMAVKGTSMRLSLPQTLELAVDRTRAGQQDSEAMDELRAVGWLTPSQDGGWLLR